MTALALMMSSTFCGSPDAAIASTLASAGPESRERVPKKLLNASEMVADGDIYRFGPFGLDPNAGILFRGAEPTMLGSRAVALLRLLLERAGVPVSKDALIEAAWPGLAVEDSNLTVQIAALRRGFLDAD